MRVLIVWLLRVVLAWLRATDGTGDEEVALIWGALKCRAAMSWLLSSIVDIAEGLNRESIYRGPSSQQAGWLVRVFRGRQHPGLFARVRRGQGVARIT